LEEGKGDDDVVPVRRLASLFNAGILTAALLLPGPVGVAPVSEAIAGSGNSWALTGSLPSPVTLPEAVKLPDGRVLVLGGNVEAISIDMFLLPIPQIFDPDTGLWSSTSDPPWAPDVLEGMFAAPLADGRVLVGGGTKSGSNGYTSADVHIYDADAPDRGTWTPTTDFPTIVSKADAVLLTDGRVMVCCNGQTPYVYDPSDETWTPTDQIAEEVRDPELLALSGGRAVRFGGWNQFPFGAAFSSSTMEIWDPDDDAWTAVPATVGTNGGAAVVLPDGRIFKAGGMTQGQSSSTLLGNSYLVNPDTLTYETVPDMTPRAEFGMAYLGDGLVLVAGGHLAEPSQSAGAQVFDVNAKKWYTAASMEDARAMHGAVVLDDGRVLMISGEFSSTAEIYTPGDFVPPAIGKPIATFRTDVKMGSSLPARITWSAADSGGSGLVGLDIERSVNGGAYARVGTALSDPTFNTTFTPGKTYRFRVRGKDGSGNVSPWVAGPTLKPKVVQQSAGSVNYSGSWATASSSKYSGGSARTTQAAGASATFKFTGRGVAYVARVGPTRGQVQVYVDGVLAETIDLYAASTGYKYVAFARSWSGSGDHKIKVVCVGTLDRPRIELDAFEVIG
jgi:hypothetical protein